MTNEAKVGLFVVAIIMAFLLLTYEIGELNLSKPDTYNITMVFSTVEGLKKSSQLEMAGVHVGNVKSITLNRDFSAVVTAAINEDIRIPIDSTAQLGTKGILGDKVIVINPGISQNKIEPEGNLARTNVPPSLDSILDQVGEIAGNLTELTGALNATLGDEESLRSIIENVRTFTEESALLVSENREDITSIVGNLRDATDDLAVISDNFSGTSEDLSDIVHTIKSGNGTIGKLIYDDSVYLSLQDSLESIQRLTSNIQDENTIGLLLSDPTLYYNLVSISENIKVVTDDIASGKGSLGRILKDDELYVNLNEAVRNVNKAAQGLDEQVPITVMGTILGFIW